MEDNKSITRLEYLKDKEYTIRRHTNDYCKLVEIRREIEKEKKAIPYKQKFYTIYLFGAGQKYIKSVFVNSFSFREALNEGKKFCRAKKKRKEEDWFISDIFVKIKIEN